MSFVCLRVDLDYVPWDTPDADQFGHGEPAMLIRLLELARRRGVRLHFFASERALRAFPTQADAVLNEGHDLDYLAKHPEQPARAEEAAGLLTVAGHAIQGWAIREPWQVVWPLPENLAFVSGPPEGHPPVRLFPVRGRTLHEAVRAGSGFRTWADASFPLLEAEGGTLVLNPQVLARVDPRLFHLTELLDRLAAAGLPLRTLREANKE